MPTIGLWVDEETKKKWEILNKHPDRVGTKKLKEALQRIIEEYEWWIEDFARFEEIMLSKRNEENVLETVDISQQEVLSEI